MSCQGETTIQTNEACPLFHLATEFPTTQLSDDSYLEDGRRSYNPAAVTAVVFLSDLSEVSRHNQCLSLGFPPVVSLIRVCCVIAVRATDKRIACDEEFSDSEDEGEGGRKNVANHKKGAKRPRVDEDKKEGEEKKTGGCCPNGHQGILPQCWERTAVYFVSINDFFVSILL